MAIVPVSQDQWLLGLGAILIATSLAIIVVGRPQRALILSRLRLHRRRTSGASTPPRSLSPAKKSLNTAASSLDYSIVFHPSRKPVFKKLAKTGSQSSSEILLAVASDVELRPKDVLSYTRAYDLDDTCSKFTSMGFSMSEIKAIGNFPHYDILTGVPLPNPYAKFDPNTAIPRPYRPFRWAYHQTMSLAKMEPDWWLEVDKLYVERIRERQELFRKYGSMVLDFLPGSELACKEVMEMCLQFYCARYPAYFSLSSDKGIFYNKLLGTEIEIQTIHPLHILLQNVPEDFAIVLRNDKDGMYYFRAGVICSALGWNVGTKIGMQLQEIHRPVPDYKEKMAFSMDRYFSKMPTDTPIQRGSWGFEVGRPLFMPPGDPHEKLRECQKPDLTIEDCYLRVDWQTLRRIPLSGGIVFNFKALFTPVMEFRDEPYIPALLLKIMKEGKKNMMNYKNTWHVEHICIPELEKYNDEQVAKGLVKPEKPDEEIWNVATLAESPFFPGWEEKWHR